MSYKKINTSGQITAVITEEININDLPTIAKSIMVRDPLIEQVGYLQNTRFTMMGGELSINGLIAGAYVIGQSGKINNFSFTLKEENLTLTLPRTLVIDIQQDIVCLKGITYQVIQGFPLDKVITKNQIDRLKILSQNTQASGFIYHENDQIMPLIYVPATSSYVWENACGSGSLAFSLITGNQIVIQPSGDRIKFKLLSDTITVMETVKEI
ncbi:hypothetical protein KBD75_02840 [Candidatus Woesebacteria bacterium]|nr:hypothetical protein [Candidatus Woesebacteria bacterium]